MYTSLFIQHAIFDQICFNKTGPAHGGGAGITQSVYPLCYGPESGFRKPAGSSCFPLFFFNVYESVHRKYILLYIQQDATLHGLFISKRHVAVTVWQIPDAVVRVVCAPDDGWRYHPKHVEQFPDINKLYNVASCWIYSKISFPFSTQTYSMGTGVVSRE
jgi:hypothetical protein